MSVTMGTSGLTAMKAKYTKAAACYVQLFTCAAWRCAKQVPNWNKSAISGTTCPTYTALWGATVLTVTSEGH